MQEPHKISFTTIEIYEKIRVNKIIKFLPEFIFSYFFVLETKFQEFK